MNIKNVKNPRWADAAKTKIILVVQFEGEDIDCEFVASHDDCTTHGPMLYNLALNGTFGVISDSDEERVLRGEIPAQEGCKVIDGKIVNVAVIEAQAEAELQRRLAEYLNPEAMAQAELDEEYAALRKTKLVELLAVKQQTGWPTDIIWPVNK